MNKARAILFDLDGTLLDTAQDIAYTINQVRQNHRLPELPFEQIRPVVGHGIRALLKLAADINENDPFFSQLVEECFTLYHQHATTATCLFPEMENVLAYLDNHDIPWGIVTNKPSRFTFDILKHLDLECRTACIVCGDTLTKHKPDPEPILYACNLLQRSPADCIYIGDSNIDMTASNAAGTTSIVALYGYIGAGDDPFSWRADGYVRAPSEIITLFA